MLFRSLMLHTPVPGSLHGTLYSHPCHCAHIRYAVLGYTVPGCLPADCLRSASALADPLRDVYKRQPKITAELRKSGEYVSEKTVGNYMRQMGIKAHWVKRCV